MGLKIVMDANIFVSAVFGGKPQKALCTAFAEGEVFICDKMKRELLDLPHNLCAKLSGGQQEELTRLLKILILQTTQVKPAIKINICRDPKDNVYLETCLTAGADILLTGDKDLLEISQKELKKADLQNLQILNPEKFLKKYSFFS